MAGIGEEILLKNRTLSLTVMPGLGGKLKSLKLGEEELLQAPLKPYAERTQTQGFEESDASGWDECLPSVSACEIRTDEGKVAVPDHGDFWRLPWKVEKKQELAVIMSASGFSLPLQFRKRVELNPWGLEVDYSVTNLGSSRTPYAWSTHPLFTVEEGDRIVLPPDAVECRVEGSTTGRFQPGQSLTWPLAHTTAGHEVDLSLACSAEAGTGEKIFFAAHHGWGSIERKRLGKRLTIHFDWQRSPWLGLWLCYGGWPLSEKARQMAVAIEPCTAPADALALAGPATRWLAPGETHTWPLHLTVTSLES